MNFLIRRNYNMNGLTDMFESFALETMGESIDDMVCEAIDMRVSRDLYLSAMEGCCGKKDPVEEMDDAMESDLDLGLDLNLGFDALNCDSNACNKAASEVCDSNACNKAASEVSDADVAEVCGCDEAFVASVFDGTISSQDMRGLEMEMSRVL